MLPQFTDTSEAPANLTSSTSTAATEVPNPTGTNPVDDGNETYYDATEVTANLTSSPNTALTGSVTPITDTPEEPVTLSSLSTRATVNSEFVTPRRVPSDSGANHTGNTEHSSGSIELNVLLPILIGIPLLGGLILTITRKFQSNSETQANLNQASRRVLI